MTDPFSVLGVGPGASEAEIRRAWRLAVKSAHPDAGGSTERVESLRVALEEALARIAPGECSATGRRIQMDVPSFTVAAPPAVSHEALLAALAGAPREAEIIDSEPPHLVEFLLRADAAAADRGVREDTWCRCELVAEAGSTTVWLTVQGAPADQVRDLLVAGLNEILDGTSTENWRSRVSGP